jgi:hypothetical protein
MILAIQEIDYEVIYLEGKANIADFLSRNPPPVDPNSPDQTLDLGLSDDLEKACVKKVQEQHSKITMYTIRNATINDPSLQFLLTRLYYGDFFLHPLFAVLTEARHLIVNNLQISQNNRVFSMTW